MAHNKAEKEIVKEISKYRAITLIHRYLYYVKASPLISDLAYDMFERKLKKLIEDNPQLAFDADYHMHCPTRCVGSDNLDDYPRKLEQLAEDISAHKGDYGKPSVLDVSVLPSSISSSEEC